MAPVQEANIVQEVILGNLFDFLHNHCMLHDKMLYYFIMGLYVECTH